MSGSYSVPLYNHRKFSASVAFFVHAALFFIGGAVFTQSAEYGIEEGLGGIEVNLTAAPAFVEAPAAGSFGDESTAQESKPVPAQPQKPETAGDGSSSVPGLDSTTLYTAAGAQTQARPNYLKNPAPRYPEAARRAGQQGVVTLWTRVTSDGRAEEVRVLASSGFPLLDEAARKAVHGWKFSPARMGSMPVGSSVQIPVRFELNKN